MGYLDEVEKKRQAAASKQSQDSDKQESISAIESGSKSVVSEIARQGEKTRANTQKVEVENTDLAKSTDVNAVVDSINKLNMTTFMASKENWVNVVNDMSELSERMQGVVSDLNKNGVNRLEKGLDATVNKLQSVVDSMKSISIKSDEDVVKGLKELSKSIDRININPTVNVPAPTVTVDGKETDLSPLATLLEDIKSQLKDNKISIPKTDFSSLEDTMRSVKTSIESLSFPVPNYILPYKDPTTGKATQVLLTSDGKVPVDATVIATVDTTGLATDTNQTDGSQKTQIVDAGGEAVTVTGGKLDVNASVDTTGLATSAKQDTGNTSIASIDTKTPALGQALAAASVPVILPSATITTLTPPAAITGFATSAKQDTLLAELQLKADLTETQPVSLASVPSHAVTNAGTFATQATIQTGTNQIGHLEANQSVNVAQMNGVTTSMGVGASGTGVQRVVLANDQGKTLLSAGGSASTSGNNTLVAAGTNRLKVYAFTLSTTSTTAMTCIFQSGAGGTELWRVVLQAPASVSTGANLVVQPPAWLFATASATLLNLNLSSANAVNWSVSYFDES